MANLTARGKALHRMSSHRGITEDPHGSNSDERPNARDSRWGIRKAQESLGAWLVGLPWCGTWCGWALAAAGVKGVSYRQASVSLIEDDARAGRAPFAGWLAPSAWRQVIRGDLVVWFNRGVHVEMVRAFKQIGGQVYVITDGGNTSSGTSGSQSNGGGSYRRVRPLWQAYGFARVDYPGGAVRARGDRVAMAVEAFGVRTEQASKGQALGMPNSDLIMLDKLTREPRPAVAADFLDDLTTAQF